MQDFVRQSNMYARMIETETDVKRRQVLQSLLDKEKRDGVLLAPGPKDRTGAP